MEQAKTPVWQDWQKKKQANKQRNITRLVGRQTYIYIDDEDSDFASLTDKQEKRHKNRKNVNKEIKKNQRDKIVQTF